MRSALGPDPLLSAELRQRLNDELRPGEKVLWSSQPRKGPVLIPSLFAVVFGAAFAGLPLAAALSGTLRKSSGSGPSIGFIIAALVFAAFGLLIMLSPLWAIRSAKRTVYAVTGQRALVLEPKGFGGWSVQTFLAERLTGMTRDERPDGSGNLIFEQFTERRGSGTTTVRRGFKAIDRVRDVEMLITSTLLADRLR